MATAVILIFLVLFFGLLSWLWVQGIDYMHTNHPDYKGDDLFGEDEEKK